MNYVWNMLFSMTELLRITMKSQNFNEAFTSVYIVYVWSSVIYKREWKHCIWLLSVKYIKSWYKYVNSCLPPLACIILFSLLPKPVKRIFMRHDRRSGKALRMPFCLSSVCRPSRTDNSKPYLFINPSASCEGHISDLWMVDFQNVINHETLRKSLHDMSMERLNC